MTEGGSDPVPTLGDLDVDPADPAAGYALLFSAVDGWELYDGDDLVAGHDGIDPDDLDQAQAWAADQLAAERQATVTGWSTRPGRHDPASVEHLAGVTTPTGPSPAPIHADPAAGRTQPRADPPPLAPLLDELAGLDADARRRRVHEVIQTLGGCPVAVQQEYRDAIVAAGYLGARDWLSALAEAKKAVVAAEDDAGKKERGPSQATLLRRLALERYRFACGDDGTPFAVPKTGPRVIRLLRGGRTSLRAELAKLYAETCHGTVPSQSALADAMLALEGQALDAAPQPLALRVAEHQGALLLDLGSPDGRVVQIAAAGWEIVDCSPVLFRRTALTGVLPAPARPGSLKPLRDRLNVTDADWPLVVGFLVAALMPAIPHPILALTGEQGSGKSTAARLLVSIVDPSPAPLRTAPRDVEQWAVAAAGSWLVGLDNISGMPPWLSDVLCRAVTGDGMVRRALWTNDDLTVLSFRRVVVLNGIDLGALRGDLSERLLSVELERITPDRRRSSQAVETLSPDEHAEVLGALIELACKVLGELPQVHLDELPRMADFALLLDGIDRVTAREGSASGGQSGLARYLAQAGQLAEMVIEADAFTAAVRAYADAQGTWTGPAATLLAGLPALDPRPRDWPKTPQAVAAGLRRAAPALRQLGYTIDYDGKGAKGARAWTLARPEKTEEQTPPTPPTPPQAPDQQQQTLNLGGVAGGVPERHPQTPPRTPPTVQAPDQHERPPGGVGGIGGVPAPAISGPPVCPDSEEPYQSLNHQINCDGLDVGATEGI